MGNNRLFYFVTFFLEIKSRNWSNFVPINYGLVLYYWIIDKLNYSAFIMDIFSSKPPDFGLSEIKSIVILIPL